MRCYLLSPLRLLTLALAASCVMAEGVTTRPARPGPEAVRKAAATVDDLYRDELARHPKPEELKALAATILSGAADEPDAATKLALLNKAVGLAIEAGDIETTAAALDQIDNIWPTDSPASRVKSMVELSRHVRTVEGQTSMAHRLAAEATQATATRQYDPAREAIEAAVECARHGNDPGLTSELSAQAAEITRLQLARERVEPALATLKSKPKDPAANLLVGRFQCFVEGDWAAGLPKLARGSDAKLKSLAQRDLADAPTAEDQVAKADGWWEWANHEEERSRRAIQAHAAEVYRKALPALAGLTRKRVQQRVDDAAHESAAPGGAPALTAQVKLLNLTNAREAGQVLDDVLHDYPGSLKDVKRATLLWYHNGIEYQRVGGGSRRLPGAFSPSPQIADSKTFLFWGINDAYKPGKYLIVSRIQALSPIGSGHVAEMDMYTKQGQGLAGHSLDASELHPGQWSTVPMIITVKEPQKADCRMYTNEQRTMALDRVYVFQLQ
jgi:hypothetical protein